MADLRDNVIEAARKLSSILPAETLRVVVGKIEQAHSITEAEAVLGRDLPHPHYRALALEFLDCAAKDPNPLPPVALAVALRAAGHVEEVHRKGQSVELVWTGPESDATPFRRTEQAILQVLDSAQGRIMLVSYAVYRIPRICAALVRAAQRGVQIRVIVETPNEVEGRNEYSTLQALGDDVATCATVYYWPRERRQVDGGGHPGILHVKCAVSDGRWLFLSSANLTDYAFTINMELGLLVTGGGLPEQVEAHFNRLITMHVVEEL
jgi:phosphatidylserine/phosphatidylglycerophosphate/cardiolipin synthase-like enzyme